MKQFIFNEDDDVDFNKITEELFVNTDTDDPASIYYKRHLERPKIYWFRIFVHILLIIIAYIVLMKILFKCGITPIVSIVISCSLLLLYILFCMKKILVCSVRIYQHFAPDSIRMKCRFEPSCSQYMIMAIEKYGALRGLLLGLKRLNRCKIGNGGFDFP